MAGAASTDFNNAEHMLKTFAGALAERDKRVAQLLVEKRVELATMEGRKFERKVGAKVQARARTYRYQRSRMRSNQLLLRLL